MPILYRRHLTMAAYTTAVIKPGGLYGFADFGLHVLGCTVQNSRVQGYREVGGLAGMISHIGDERTASHEQFGNKYCCDAGFAP